MAHCDKCNVDVDDDKMEEHNKTNHAEGGEAAPSGDSGGEAKPEGDAPAPSGDGGGEAPKE